MDPNDPIARRFPLVARPRPACLPLAERVHGLLDLSETAVQQADPVRASAVYNQSALIASDLGLPALARELCHQHAHAYLWACPLPGQSAIRALEPVVNLARLHARAGKGDTARQYLHTLYEAVTTGTAVQLDSITVPAHLTATTEDRRQVRTWLWTVLLADGTRALTSQGRWNEALTHIESHRGVGQRLLDGRQVAVLAALTAGRTAEAVGLLHDSAPGEPWEQAVAVCLTAVCRRGSGLPADRPTSVLSDMYERLEPEPGTAVFNTRLGLTILDITGNADAHRARCLVGHLHRRATALNDGYAARENLTHPMFTALATDVQQKQCRDLVIACALGAGTIPDELFAQLTVALRRSDHTIREAEQAR
ncbi:hypothetical protein I3J09_16335 [Streptomyces clavuligerus]|uniref:Uncharacterized protein n=1 Tax=Streptomyces clavuligerus TaxID=1901 RepID=B5GPH3_STRCL|nr:hypothetical protein [Streptomyces clavuligerus]ANW19635.1 hypothetical protein BB341_16110 [Streptomyces clavuligerus]AXU14244.1 hypothetical protein D1794_16810 [Streptomyces clavuligerus]EDY48219.1 conserved hypothetical protein [Streptomyces clavuligerus]EFG07542.1 Hypothetical protein SCLAV_2469 [Streptomyces clavuligerus]MBY6304245.1 hypothetical protein [Streptomyces clavuligerus]